MLLPFFLVILTLTDGLGEELSWRSFALPRLLSRHNALAASLILGVLWALWHLPLVWTEGSAMYLHPSGCSSWTYRPRRGPLHLGLPAYPRKRAPCSAVARGDQPICRVAGPE
jgi:membrane protease YdiL (CAAX protease family)